MDSPDKLPLPLAVIKELMNPSRPSPDILHLGVTSSQDSLFLSALRRIYDDPSQDLPAARTISLPPHGNARIPTGLACALPVGTVGLIIGRYSAFDERGLIVPITLVAGGFRGELVIPVINSTKWTIAIQRTERIAQLLVLPVWQGNVLLQPYAELPKDGKRGEVKPGSTGR